MDVLELGGDRTIGPEEPTYVIAEAGSNHNGDLETAKRLIEVAAKAGADAVKFQTFRAEEVYVEESGSTEYLGEERPIYEVISELEMPYDWVPELHDYCREHGVDFLSSATDSHSVDIIEEYVPAFKIPSYTMSHFEFLDYVAEKGKPIILSTGAHEFNEIREAVERLRDRGVTELVVLHCVAAYPTPLESINVRVVERIQDELGVLSGLSDHTLEPTAAPCAAVALGGCVVEKHFTLDRSMEGPDHGSSLEPAELNQMVSSIRDTERALGTADRPVYDVERELYETARRRIHATKDIPAGEKISRDNTAILRSGKQPNGLTPKHYTDVLGMVTTRPISAGHGIRWEMIDS